MKDILAIERVQRSFSKRLPGLTDKSYSERLRILGLHSLEKRRVFRDLVFVYKILNSLVDLDSTRFFNLATYDGTRNNGKKLTTNRSRLDCHKYTFKNRAIGIHSLQP